MKDVIARWEDLLQRTPAALKLIGDEETAARPGLARWSQREILGHVIDSALNNHQRFVRVQLSPSLALPSYEQEAWVRIGDYQHRAWPELIELWTMLNRQLLDIVRAIPDAALEHTCALAGRPPVTLAFLIRDYLTHLEHHLEQILGAGVDRVRELHELYRREWWTGSREAPDIERMLRHTGEVIAIRDAGSPELIGFARVLTDGVYKALILDVIVKESHRREGCGKKVMEAILNHPRLARVRHFELYCRPEMMGFYQKWGFTAELGELRFMRLSRP